MNQHRNVLADHGTELMVLKPSSVLQAAKADMARRVRNAEIAAERTGPSWGRYATGPYEHYAFHREHVRKAVDAHDLLARAMADPAPGLSSNKPNTRLLYGDSALLLDAVRLGSSVP